MPIPCLQAQSCIIAIRDPEKSLINPGILFDYSITDSTELTLYFEIGSALNPEETLALETEDSGFVFTT